MFVPAAVLESNSEAIPARTGRRFELIDVDEPGVGPNRCSGQRRIDIARAVQLESTDRRVLDAQMSLSTQAPLDSQASLDQIRESNPRGDSHDARSDTLQKHSRIWKNRRARVRNHHRPNSDSVFEQALPLHRLRLAVVEYTNACPQHCPFAS